MICGVLCFRHLSLLGAARSSTYCIAHSFVPTTTTSLLPCSLILSATQPPSGPGGEILPKVSPVSSSQYSRVGWVIPADSALSEVVRHFLFISLHHHTFVKITQLYLLAFVRVVFQGFSTDAPNLQIRVSRPRHSSSSFGPRRPMPGRVRALFNSV